MEDFTERLDSLRRPGESKRDFARRLSISPVQLSRYYSGVSPGRKILERISQKTGAGVDWLLYGEPGKTPARRLAARTSKRMSDDDRVNLACSYIDELKKVDREGREVLKQLLKESVKDAGRRDKLLSYLDFIKFEDARNKSR